MLCKYDFVRFIVDLFVGPFNCLNFSLEKKREKKREKSNGSRLLMIRDISCSLQSTEVNCMHLNAGTASHACIALFNTAPVRGSQIENLWERKYRGGAMSYILNPL